MIETDYYPEIIPADDDSVSQGYDTVDSFRHDRESRRNDQNLNREKTAPKKSAPKRSIFAFFKDQRFTLVVGIIVILTAVYLLLSAISYIFQGAADQSEVMGKGLEDIVANPYSDIKNIGGPAGALFSHHFLTLGLGLGGIPILIYLILIGLALLKVRKCKFWSLTFKTLLFSVTLSVVLGFFFYNSNFVLPPGGFHGIYLNDLIIQRFSWIGAAGVSLALMGCVAGVYLYDLQKLWKAYKKKSAELKEKFNRMKPSTDDVNSEYAGFGTFKDDSRKQEEEAATENHESDIFSSQQGDSDEPEEIAGQAARETSQVASLADIVQPDDQPENTGKSTDEPAGSVSNEETVVDEPTESADVAETFEINETNEIKQAKKTNNDIWDPTAELSRFKMPTIDLLRDGQDVTDNVDVTEIEDKKNQIIEALAKLKIGVAKIEATVGPTVTMYEIVPAEGVKIATIKRLEDDIALALAALSTRIIAPIPGKSAIGIEVPNREPQTVSVKKIFGSVDFQNCKYELPIALGATINNEVYIADLAKMPHLLVAGATGKGKSVGMNIIINSLLFKKHPAELKFVLVDPKMVEFYPYRKLENHYLAKLPDAEDAIITDTSKVVETLKSLCQEMDNRYRLLMDAEVVKITDYNKLFVGKKLNPEKGHRFLPYIVVIVDEYADLVMTAGKEVETPIARLAQKARAVGIHVIIATQRPSATIITGVIKANFPARIAFKVSSRIDSNIILESNGAQQLIGKGDMLISNDSEMVRVQCAFIDTPEIKEVTRFIGDQAGFPTPLLLPEVEIAGEGGGSIDGANFGDKDPLFEEVARLVISTGVASTSGIQRRYSIGYNRAGKIMDQMEACGIVGPAKGGKARDILVDMFRLEEILNNQ